MTGSLTQCRDSMGRVLWLMLAAGLIGVLVGSSVALGLCAVLYMINR